MPTWQITKRLPAGIGKVAVPVGINIGVNVLQRQSKAYYCKASRYQGTASQTATFRVNLSTAGTPRILQETRLG